ncbi:MAG: hypothetical protein RLZZ290_1640 [Pseudomonadota bacterium]|jgi:tellurite resistance protein
MSQRLWVRLPVSSFAITMGLAGLSLLWGRLSALPNAPTWAPAFVMAAALLTVLIFVFLVVVQAIRWIRTREAVMGEWKHPVKSAFFSTFSVSLMLLSLLSIRFFAPLALPLWVAGAGLHILLMLLMLKNWMTPGYLQPAHPNPAWFIPAVGNVVIPLAGVPLGFMVLSWWAFGLGILFWLVLLTLVLSRIFLVQPGLPDRLLPTLCILIAPPAVSFLSWLLLTRQYPDGIALDAGAEVLMGLSIFFSAMFLLSLKVILKGPFFLSWWAMSFPLAALAQGAVLYDQFSRSFSSAALASLSALLASALILWLLLRTFLALWREEPQLID